MTKYRSPVMLVLMCILHNRFAHNLKTGNSFYFRGYSFSKFFSEGTSGRNAAANEFFQKRYAQRITNQFDYKSSRQPVNGIFYFPRFCNFLGVAGKCLWYLLRT